MNFPKGSQRLTGETEANRVTQTNVSVKTFRDQKVR